MALVELDLVDANDLAEAATISPRIKAFVQPQSWSQDLVLVSV